MIRMSKLVDFAVFSWYFFVARLVRAMQSILDRPGSLGVAMISCYRDQVDVRKFGFWSIDQTPDILSWTRYVWEGKIKGRLYMVGSLTEEIAGDKATEETQQNACDQFKSAVCAAAKAGAEVILYAAATKRLSEIERPCGLKFKDELARDFPSVTFTLGDNFTGLLLGEQIMLAFKQIGLNPKKSRVLVIAPYGLLGGVALHYLHSCGVEVVGLGNPKRLDLLQGLKEKFGISVCTSFEEVGEVDMVVACNTSPSVQLTPERVELIRRKHRKLTLIDPCEPANMPPDFYRECGEKVVRIDGGNAHSIALKYILGALDYKLLRLGDGITWGCFAETFILGLYPQLRGHDWMEISPKNIGFVSDFLGEKEGQFSLTVPLCFNLAINQRSFNSHLPSGKLVSQSISLVDARKKITDKLKLELTSIRNFHL